MTVFRAATVRERLYRHAKIALLALLALPTHAQTYLPNLSFDHAAIQYQTAPTTDPVSKLLDRRIDSLSDLLQALRIPVDSQALVFSKTSFQAAKISPRNPRAIYFNDEVAVGWVRGGDGMEIASTDPKQGVIFYTVNPQGAIQRRQECVHCHYGAATLGVPGMFVGSVFPDSSGAPSRDRAIITDHRTPFADRWGGWYVNAKSGQQPDRANSFALDPAEPQRLATEGRQNLPDLTREFNPQGYLSPVSDIVALMVFEHQTQVTNRITRLQWQSRMGEPLDNAIADLVDYLLFVDEVPLSVPLKGVSTFTETFPQRGPRDRQGRSLREFDLQTRLFKFPLSYMIYSPAFAALPVEVRMPLLRRIDSVLSGDDRSPKFSRLTPVLRRAIHEILRDTLNLL